jgi:NADPH:quinone reductase-like Zn-dependent oxidoreductase
VQNAANSGVGRSFVAEDIRAEIGDARVAPGVDSVGGTGVGRLIDVLSPGRLVTYGAASGQPMSISHLGLISKQVTVRGFLRVFSTTQQR